jgi:hypothetical protein
MRTPAYFDATMLSYQIAFGDSMPPFKEEDVDAQIALSLLHRLGQLQAPRENNIGKNVGLGGK